MRIKHILFETSKFFPCIIVNHLLAPPILWEGASKIYTMESNIKIGNNIENIYSKIMNRDRVETRIKIWKFILDSHPEIKIIIFEGFPFCRHQFAYELITFLQIANERKIKCVCSIRDFPWDEPHSLGVQDWIAITQNLILNNYFDKILVHGDEKILPLVADTTQFCNKKDLIKDISNLIIYTGYVKNPEQKRHHKENNNIFISFGLNKEEVYMLSERFHYIASQFPEYKFIFLSGDTISNKKPKQKIANNLIFLHYLKNLNKEIEKCSLYITYAGYNSTVEVLATGCPAILIPRRNGYKLEQAVRIKTLKKYNLFKVGYPIDARVLTPIIKQILDNPDSINKNHNINLEGAKNSANEIRRIVES